MRTLAQRRVNHQLKIFETVCYLLFNLSNIQAFCCPFEGNGEIFVSFLPIFRQKFLTNFWKRWLTEGLSEFACLIFNKKEPKF